MALAFIIITIYAILNILFQIKHFLADYPLQNEYMLGKFKTGYNWVKPLTAHVAVHGILTFFILLLFCNWLSFVMIFFLSFLDMTIHFIMDRVKASPNLLGYFKPLSPKEYLTADSEQKKNNKYFWWCLGLDQFVHHITHELIVYIAIISLVFSF
jgi:hypothetical protein